MDRRGFVGTICGMCGIAAGCLSRNDTPATAEIARLELENHRRDASYEFDVQIEEEEVVFEETRELEPAGSGNEVVAFEHPVEPGTYTVRVDADRYSASVETDELVSADQTGPDLQFYLSDTTLHAEHQLYDRCE